MHKHLEHCLAIILEATRCCGPESVTRRNPKQWSVVEIVEHLTRAYSGTAKGFERCLEKNAPLATGTTFKQRLRQFVVIDLGFFPAGIEAPKYILPSGELDLNAVLAAVRRDLTRLDEAAVKASNNFGTVKVLDHPILGALSVDQWLRFHVSHTRHHEKQIRERR
jgi:hypothetical protein